MQKTKNKTHWFGAVKHSAKVKDDLLCYLFVSHIPNLPYIFYNLLFIRTRRSIIIQIVLCTNWEEEKSNSPKKSQHYEFFENKMKMFQKIGRNLKFEKNAPLVTCLYNLMFTNFINLESTKYYGMFKQSLGRNCIFIILGLWLTINQNYRTLARSIFSCQTDCLTAGVLKYHDSIMSIVP